MKTQHHYTIPCGLFLIALCLFIRYQVGKRRFNRRSITGLQQFSSYRQYQFIITVEAIILFIANLLGLAGTGLLVVAGINHYKF